ncbi:MAG: type II secretion system protein GspE [Acidobacteria bacterium]|nr:MAG: type II secretion system protein GspE [Acidobacteriota bacterium]MCL4286073.1 Flp pilus assembly complex ATPase component TadA [Thermoleophilia bacterium]GIK77360.1 MAG: type II secretion system protein E [Actinomycetes bacterium]
MSEPGDRYGHLRPVPSTPPAPAVSGSEALEPEPATGGTPGLTPPRTRTHSGRFITDVAVELGYLTRERVDQAIDEARVAGRSPEALMVDQGVLSADQLSRAVAERYGLDHVDLNVFHVDMGAANLVSVQTARRFHAVPVSYVDSETLLVAMADPANVLAVDDMKMMTGLNCRVAVAAEVDIEGLISRLNSLESAVSEAISEDEEEAAIGGADVTELRESADDAPVIKLVYSILGQAVNEGASDVHFEIEEKDMRVRFRVDGVLTEAARVPRRMVAGVISRVKIMSELDIAEKRIPQDGRVAVNVNDRRIDLRVVTVPTERGEGATIRILDKTEALRTLDELGFSGDARRRFTEAYTQPYGAVLVTGPTGSGKSTTLYSALAELNDVDKNIITIEDPVEYQLPGINQMGVNRKAGLDFATGLRSILRADPDVIMVGEVRDPETARIAIEAALTGHMVLTTLHTNDAPSAVTRLAKMGIESFLTASAVDCVVAQRLARTLCTDCKRRTVLEQAVLEEAGFRVGTDIEAWDPVGCARCGGTGYRGRAGLFSVMRMSEQLKDLTVAGAPQAELTRLAREEGMQTLREDGLAKVKEGVTSIAEVARVAV